MRQNPFTFTPSRPLWLLASHQPQVKAAAPRSGAASRCCRSCTGTYQRDQDTVGRFVDDLCELGDKHLPPMSIKVSAIRTAYESWCHVEGETP